MPRSLLVLALTLAVCAPAAAQTGVDDVDARTAFAFDDVDAVAPAGDVDGDGTQDVLTWDRNEYDEAVGVRVVLGGDRVPGLRGFRIRGVDPELFTPPAGVGDVNGDGRDDLALPTDDGVALVLGRAAPRDLDLDRPRSRDVLITGGIEGGARAGDVNGDGLADVVLFAQDSEDERPRGAVLFGRRDLAGTVDVRRLGSGGQTLLAPRDAAVFTAVGAGDVDGDGLGDLVVGSPITGESRTGLRGAGYVVYGRRAPGVVDLDAAGTTRLTTERDITLGVVVAGPGDVDGDGLGDVALGAPAIGLDDDTTGAGRVVVLFGARARPATVSVDALGERGFEAVGTRRSGLAGIALAPAGDVDRDGRRDLVIGEPSSLTYGEDGGDREGEAAVHVVFGARRTGTVPLDGARTLTLRGGGGDALATSVAAGSDLDGDGQAELLVARPTPCTLARFDRPQVVAVEPGAPAVPRPPGLGTPGIDRQSGSPVGDTLAGFGGDDALSGRDGHDCLLGGDGSDRLEGGLSGDALLGGTGADVLIGGSGCDKIFGGDGDDVIPAGPATVALAEALRAPIGARDQDTVLAGAGNDRVTSGSDRDHLEGQDGDDRLDAGAADDRLSGGLGADRLAGGPGDDVLDGGPGADLLRGGTGDDRLYGFENEEDEEYEEGPGRGRPGRDVLDGGAGDDVIDAYDGHRDVVRCGPGRDRAEVDFNDAVRGCERVRRHRRPERPHIPLRASPSASRTPASPLARRASARRPSAAGPSR